jgi:hypothetical protein
MQIKNFLLQLHILNSMELFVMKETTAYFAGRKHRFTFHHELKRFVRGIHRFLHIQA